MTTLSMAQPASRLARSRPSSADLAQCLAALAVGDDAAFEPLYRATRTALHGVAIAVLHDDDAASDALQESYVKIWQHAGQFDGARAQPMTWLISIVRNHCVDVLRRDRQVLVPLDDTLADTLPDAAPQPDAHAVAAQTARRLWQAWQQLNSDQRQALSLSIDDELTHEDIARALNTPLGTIKSRLRRGLAALARQCELTDTVSTRAPLDGMPA